MYYESRWIDGVLFWRGTPTGEWSVANAAHVARWYADRDPGDCDHD